ncbi:MAG TPA: hypothetical protein VFJ57_01990 [Solirubrobacterales bacterium]|nr:hypothetical protein [Solirubrobacterales bacterium]
MATGKEGLETGRAGESPPSGRGVSNPVLILLVWLVGISGGLLLYWGSKLTFLLDDWEFLLYRRGFDSHAILDPHGEHIVVIPVLVYKALLAVFGMGSALPFRVVSTGLFLLSAVLLFVFLKRRVGEWPALAATAVVLFLGAAWEDLLWSFQIGYFGCMAAGIGALLALEREGRRRDVIATTLLSLGILLSSLGLSFIAGAAVQVLRREDRWRRLWVFLVPLAIYAIWYLGWGHTAEHAASWANFAKTPAFILNSLAASLASAFGLFLPAASESPGGLDWGRPILVALALLGAWRLAKLGKAPRWLWVVVAIGGSFWFLAGLNQIPGRDPTASRYQYIGVVFVLLIAAELLRGIKISPRVTVVVVLVAAAAIAPNVYYLHQAYLSYRGTSQLEKADLGALDIARETVEPGFVLEEDIADTGYVHVDAASYFSAEDEFGTPAYSSDELLEASAPARFAADKVLWAALRAEVTPIPASQAPSKGCATVEATSELPPGGGIVVAGEQPIEDVKLARFSSGEPPIDLQQQIEPGAGLRITIPEDRSTVPWRVLLETSGPSQICDLEGR